uniref:START domain-containing protein n=1 Tax=Globodera rostochiensis TaxID=31243 RepID=A0A914HU93_GLORO
MGTTTDVTLPPFNAVRPSDAMRLNAVQVLEDVDFHYAKELCDGHADWTLAYERKRTRVWTRRTDGQSPLQMIKTRSEFPDVPAALCYDVLQDTEYRLKWDKYVQKTVPIGFLNPNNDICYYALGGLPPFQSRDFVLLRSWLDVGLEKYILAHSVWHDKFPPSKTHIRGVVHLTVHFMRSSADGKGCQFTYVTLADPKGKLPSWLTNHVTKIVAPKLVKKLHKACLGYAEWKKRRDCQCLTNGETLLHDYPRIRLADCEPKEDNNSAEFVDETAVPRALIGEEEEEEDEREGREK